MKKYTYIILAVLLCWTTACKKLDTLPPNIVNDNDIFSNAAGIQAYMARMYSTLPIEDFRYSPQRGLNFFWIISPFSAVSGEALSRDQNNAMQESLTFDNRPTTWSLCYGLIRDANYFSENLPKFASNFTPAQINAWLGEARFLRAATYFALVKRYGGVPIVDKVLNYPAQSIDELKIPRSSEEKVYDFISADLDYAYTNLPESNQVGRANKYVAAGFKSRAMLYAGSIAKYNQISFVDGGGNRLCGIPAAKAVVILKPLMMLPYYWRANTASIKNRGLQAIKPRNTKIM